MALLERIALVLLLGGAVSCLPEFTADEIPTGAAGSGGTGGGAGGQGGGEPPCHPPDLVDTFDDSSVDTTLWSTQGATDTISVYSGSLHFRPVPNQPDQWAGLVTKISYDVTGCSVWVQVPSLIHNGLAGHTYFQLYNGGALASFEVGGGVLTLAIGDGPPQEMSYSPEKHLWWQIREEGGTLFLETAPDGLSWTVGHSAPTPPPIDNAAVGLGVVPVLSPTPGETTLDNLNALP